MNSIYLRQDTTTTEDSSGKRLRPKRAVLFINCIPPYLSPVLRHLSSILASFKIFVSTAMEPDRSWENTWQGLEVTTQKSFFLTLRKRHVMGFANTTFRHFPYDTLPLLFRNRPDVIISSELGFRTIQSVVYRLISPRCRLVIWVDGSEHTERSIGALRTLIRRILIMKADAILVVGESGARYVRQLGVPHVKIISTSHVTDMKPFQSISFHRDSYAVRRIIYVGRLVEGKGLENFIQQMFKFAHLNPSREFDLWLVGDGPLRSSLERLPIRRGVSLRIIGNVRYDQLANYYCEAGACVLPTFSDTWGLVVNEALAAGVPVLGSRYSQAVEELIQDGVNGWKFRPDVPGETQSVLQKFLLASDDALARMRRAARDSVQHLTPEYAVNRFLKAMAVAMRGESRVGSSYKARQ